MNRETSSLDEFLSKRQHEMHKGAVFKASRAPASWNADARSARFVMSAQVEDRDGDVVYTAGIDLSQFVNNPVCLLNHRSSELLGTWSNVVKKPKALEGDAVLMPAGVDEDCDKVANWIEHGVIRACSIGFIPKTVKRIVLENGDPTWSFEIVECELVECSIVSIPANPMALAKSAESSIAYDLIEEVLDTYAKDPRTGLIVPKAQFEAAHKKVSADKTIATPPPAGWLAGIREEIAAAIKGLGVAPAAAVIDKQQEAIVEEQEALPPLAAILKAKAEATAALG